MHFCAKGGFTVLENELTAQDKRKKFWYELKDLLAGAAFPVMLMLILSASIISFASYEDFGISVLVLVVGEVLLGTAYVIFGRQNGITAMRRTVQNKKKRAIGTDDKKALWGVGEYAIYKGIIIAAISCVPYILVQIIGSAAPNVVCDFLLRYAFGWAFYPLSYCNASSWLNLLWIIPLCAVHTLAYFWGGYTEKTKQSKISEAQNVKGKSKNGKK